MQGPSYESSIVMLSRSTSGEGGAASCSCIGLVAEVSKAIGAHSGTATVHARNLWLFGHLSISGLLWTDCAEGQYAGQRRFTSS